MSAQAALDNATISTVAALTESVTAEVITPLIDYSIYYFVRLISGPFLTTVIAVIGVFTNTINIVVYYKMGLQETTNINFFTLAISDWFSAICLVLIMITDNLTVKLPSGAPTEEITHLVSFIMYANSVTAAFITTILSLERCLCIVIPLKVKKIVTRRRVVVVTSTLVVYELVFTGLLIGRTGPPYASTNLTKAIYLMCSYSIVSLICFVIITLTTIFLIIRLNQSLSWRKKTSTAAASGQATSNKEAKATRCVILICGLFIFSFFPNLFVIVFAVVFPTFNLWDPYFTRLAYILCYCSFICQAISISANTLVYYTSSTRYKQIFRSLFPCFEEEKQ
ncbi:chemosensory receptor a [Plakobranchus ocellatus]|uniref:Chemosensory receptor a n=1 Tax=Plakobranchus ocellatus TaxID=259542 RepID=A0AAV4DW27_9GAST|nr:chemosensory receptor a [Plakobranchus ocellatus]